MYNGNMLHTYIFLNCFQSLWLFCAEMSKQNGLHVSKHVLTFMSLSLTHSRAQTQSPFLLTSKTYFQAILLAVFIFFFLAEKPEAVKEKGRAAHKTIEKVRCAFGCLTTHVLPTRCTTASKLERLIWAPVLRMYLFFKGK